MKTAVSLPDELFRRGERTARRMRVSRSQLYATALAEFLERTESKWVTEQLNRVYGDERARVDPVLRRAAFKSLPKDSW